MRNSLLASALAAGLVLSGCATAPQYSGQSLATPQLRADTLAMLTPYNAARTGCDKIDAVDTSVVTLPSNVQANPDGTVLRSSPARERWVATSCGNQAAYQVDFIPDGSGGNFVSIKAEGAQAR